MPFNDRWFTGQKRQVVQAALDLSRLVAGEVIEIGCWEGQSSVWIANRIGGATLHCFDWWIGSPNDETWQKAQERDVYATFEENMREHTEGNYQVWKGDWRKTLPTFDVGLIRFAYIDATHTFEEVADCLMELLPKLSPGGVICGDDWNLYPGVGEAATAILGDSIVVPKGGHGNWYWRDDVLA